MNVYVESNQVGRWILNKYIPSTQQLSPATLDAAKLMLYCTVARALFHDFVKVSAYSIPTLSGSEPTAVGGSLSRLIRPGTDYQSRKFVNPQTPVTSSG